MKRPNTERKRKSYIVNPKTPSPSLQRMVRKELFQKLQISRHDEHSIADLPHDFKEWVGRIFDLKGDISFENMTYSEIASVIIIALFEKIPKTT